MRIDLSKYLFAYHMPSPKIRAICLSIYVSIYMRIFLSMYLFAYHMTSGYPSVYLCIYLHIDLSMNLIAYHRLRAICLSICLSVYLSIYLYLYLYIYIYMRTTCPLRLRPWTRARNRNR